MAIVNDILRQLFNNAKHIWLNKEVKGKVNIFEILAAQRKVADCGY